MPIFIGTNELKKKIGETAQNARYHEKLSVSREAIGSRRSNRPNKQTIDPKGNIHPQHRTVDSITFLIKNKKRSALFIKKIKL